MEEFDNEENSLPVGYFVYEIRIKVYGEGDEAEDFKKRLVEAARKAYGELARIIVE